MPKSQLDWLGVVSLWLSAAIMAIKAGGLPLVAGAPDWLAANWWNYVPLLLISVFLVIALYRQFRPHELRSEVAPAPAVAPRPSCATQDEQSEKTAAILALSSAKRSARSAMANAAGSGTKERKAELQMPAVRAALLSAHKLFGTPMPPEAGKMATSLELHLRTIEEMLPYLTAGHIDEARAKAQALIDYVMDQRPQGEA